MRLKSISNQLNNLRLKTACQMVLEIRESKNYFSTSKNCGKFLITGNLSVDGKLNDSIGSFVQLKHVFTQDEVNEFAVLNGDNNPLHIDPIFAKTTMFGGTIVHGIFVSSLFSTLFGRSIPGSIYISQKLNFKRPVHVGKEVIASIEVTTSELHKKGKIITCSTTCKYEDGTTAVDGEAKVLLPIV
mmetsp:Transcript_21895/g.30107  ORF Transcript_21895/g.30107 Transcript_21895/m.30107 type:complete len:186 (+) Transcript_21895:23-580(+)